MAIKQLILARNIYIACLIEELSTKFEYILYTSCFKNKSNFKSSIINYTHICALKPSYSCKRV
jgi:hypothetical protein